MNDRVFVRLGIIVVLVLSLAGFAETSNSILLVIDMQSNLLAHGKGGLHVDSLRVDSLIKKVNENIKSARLRQIPVAYIVNEWTNPFVNFFTDNVCKKGAPGTGLDPRLNIADSLIYHKSYANAFDNASLAAYVKQNSINKIYIMGIMAEGCVYATAKSGLQKGYDILLIAPAIGSSSQAKVGRAIKELVAKGANEVSQVE
jgi:nicotinamidase-related amidase